MNKIQYQTLGLLNLTQTFRCPSHSATGLPLELVTYSSSELSQSQLFLVLIRSQFNSEHLPMIKFLMQRPDVEAHYMNGKLGIEIKCKGNFELVNTVLQTYLDFSVTLPFHDDSQLQSCLAQNMVSQETLWFL